MLPLLSLAKSGPVPALRLGVLLRLEVLLRLVEEFFEEGRSLARRELAERANVIIDKCFIIDEHINENSGECHFRK